MTFPPNKELQRIEQFEPALASPLGEECGLTSRSSRRPSRFAGCPRLSLVVRLLESANDKL